jgi:hypothetical protein
MKLFESGVINFTRCTSEEISALIGLGESDDIANRGEAQSNSDETIESECESTVRRTSMSESIKKMSKSFDLCRWESQHIA